MLEIFDIVFNTVFDMLHNNGEFQNCTFHIFHTFNARSSLYCYVVFLSRILHTFLDELSYNLSANVSQV